MNVALHRLEVGSLRLWFSLGDEVGLLRQYAWGFSLSSYQVLGFQVQFQMLKAYTKEVVDSTLSLRLETRQRTWAPADTGSSHGPRDAVE